MRLIDADAITKETFVEFVGNQEFISFNDALWMISEQPTAYDVDSIVEQLTENADYEPIDYDCGDVGCTADDYFISLDKAIEIVKGGAE